MNADEVTVTLVGPLRRPHGLVGDVTTVPVTPGTTAGDVLAGLGYAPTERRALRVLRKDVPLRLDEPVAAGDDLLVFLLVGGG
jgi:sulfur carrier protein ThiS